MINNNWITAKKPSDVKVGDKIRFFYTCEYTGSHYEFGTEDTEDTLTVLDIFHKPNDKEYYFTLKKYDTKTTEFLVVEEPFSFWDKVEILRDNKKAAKIFAYEVKGSGYTFEIHTSELSKIYVNILHPGYYTRKNDCIKAATKFCEDLNLNYEVMI